MLSVLGNKLIEIDTNEIRITSKKGDQKEIIQLDQVDKLIIKKNYVIPQDSFKEVSKEVSGKTNKNYLILHQSNQNRRLDFEIDSYYMINQLNKIIESWKQKGYVFEKVS
ncbi:MAG: hypothetical protein AAFO07_14340 [Bacteroidota bacterium]